jgi:CheY-like chemotaxis protein
MRASVASHKPKQTIRLELPLGLTSKQTPRTEVASSTSEKTKPDEGSHRRVLVVDDNRDARDSLALLLGAKGYAVLTARDSSSALEAAATFQPRVAILDIVMPGASGFKTAELLRQQEGLRDIIIITVTGWQDEMDDWLSKHAGANYHLLKPLDMEKLQTILDKHFPM